MACRESAGFALLEVVVAIALLGVVVLAIAETIGAGVRYTGAAEATRRSLAHASSIAEAARSGTVDVSGACFRRVVPAGRWLWIEVTCAPGSGRLTEGPGLDNRGPFAGGRPVRLVVAR